jgi:membrane protein implicated in regulation of membrane protease activity
MVFVGAVLLAIFVLPSPWGLVAIIVGGIWELAQTFFAIRWSQRRRARVGAEALVGVGARVVTRCAPSGRVAVGGEIWNARCDHGADVGDTVRVRGVQGITLLVERAQETVSAPASHQST